MLLIGYTIYYNVKVISFNQNIVFNNLDLKKYRFKFNYY